MSAQWGARGHVVSRYNGLRRAVITVRKDGLLDVLRERDGSGETFRGCATLDEAFAVIRAHVAPRETKGEER